MTPNLIAICSPVMESGKSAFAQRLVDQHGYALVKFAAPVKSMTEALLSHLGYHPTQASMIVEEASLKNRVIPGHEHIDLTARRIMQTIGTEWGRELIHRDFWAGIAANWIRLHHRCGQRVVVDDMRFPNELGCIRGLGGYPLRIVRPGQPQATAHPSEHALDREPMVEVLNGGTLEELHAKADALATGKLHPYG